MIAYPPPQTYLFIGGPLDGKRFTLSEPVREIRTERITPFHTMDAPTELPTSSYIRQEIGSANDYSIVYLYSEIRPREMILMLIGGYNPKASSHGR